MVHIKPYKTSMTFDPNVTHTTWYMSILTTIATHMPQPPPLHVPFAYHQHYIYITIITPYLQHSHTHTIPTVHYYWHT